jgi:hypothetical protein
MGERSVAQKVCDEQRRLSSGLSQAIRYVIEMQSSQIAAVRLGDTRTERFEEEINAAIQAWKRARKLYMEHLRDHGCATL